MKSAALTTRIHTRTIKNSTAICFIATGISWRILTKSRLLRNINFSNWQEQMATKLFSKFRSKFRLQKEPVLPNVFCFDFKVFHSCDQNMESFSTKKKSFGIKFWVVLFSDLKKNTSILGWFVDIQWIHIKGCIVCRCISVINYGRVIFRILQFFLQ